MAEENISTNVFEVGGKVLTLDELNEVVAKVLKGKGPSLLDCIVPEDKARWDELVEENNSLRPHTHRVSNLTEEQKAKRCERVTTKVTDNIDVLFALGMSEEEILAMIKCAKENKQ